MKSLAERGISAAKWGIALTVARIVIQIGSQAILARLLGPEYFGIFGMALVVYIFVMFLAEFGFGMYLLLKVELSPDDVRFIATLQIMFGIAAAIALIVFAPLVAGWFADERVKPVLEFMAISCVLSAAAGPSSQLLTRDLNFRALGMIDLLSYAVGYLVVGLSLGLAGAGVMTLVAAWLTQSAVRCLAVNWVRPHSWRPLFGHPEAAEVFNLGRNVFFTLLINWILTNIDRVLIGRYLGPQLVGLYNAGFNLSSTASTVFISTLQTVFLASGAQVSKEPERLRRVYLQILASIWIIAAPLFLLLALLANDIVAVLYGSKWVGAGEVLQALLIAVPAALTLGMSTPMLWNTGRGYLEPLLQVPVLVFFLGGLLVAVDYGIVAVAWCVAATLGLRGLVVAVAACRIFAIESSELVPQLARGLVMCLLVGLAAFAGAALGEQMGGGFIRTVLTASVPLASMMLAVVLWPALLGNHASALAIRLVPGWSRLMGTRLPTDEPSRDHPPS